MSFVSERLGTTNEHNKNKTSNKKYYFQLKFLSEILRKSYTEMSCPITA